jgi:hypothetical protein
MSQESTTMNITDALIEHDPDDPDFGPPESWPAEWDDDVAALGPARGHDEAFHDQPTADDLAAYYDLLEQIEYEHSCRMFFSPDATSDCPQLPGGAA